MNLCFDRLCIRFPRAVRLVLMLLWLCCLPVAQSQTLLPCGLPAEHNFVSGDVSYTMSANCQLTGQISILNDAKLTVNGGGYTITGRDEYDLFFYVSDNATLVINNATLDGQGIRRSQLVDVRGTVEMTKVTVRKGSNGPPVYLAGTGDFTDVLFENNDPSAYGKARSGSALRVAGGTATVEKAVFRDNYGGGGAITVENWASNTGSLTTKGCLLFSGNVPYDVQVKSGSWTKSHSGTCTGKIGNGHNAVIAAPALTACGLPARGNLDKSATYVMSKHCKLLTTKANDPYWDIPEGATIKIKGNGYTIGGGGGSNFAWLRVADNATLELENVALDRIWLHVFGDIEAKDTTFSNAPTRAIWLEGGADLERVLFRGNTTGRENQATALMAASYFNDGEATIKNSAFKDNSGTHASSPSYTLNTHSSTASITLEGCITYSGNTPSDKNYLASANITDNSTGACGAAVVLGHRSAAPYHGYDYDYDRRADDGDDAGAGDDGPSRDPLSRYIGRMEGCFQRLGMLAILCRYRHNGVMALEVWKVHADSTGSLAMWLNQTQFDGRERESLVASTADGRLAVYLVNGECTKRDEHGEHPRIANVDCVAAKLRWLREGGGNPLGRFKYIAVAKGPTNQGKVHTIYLDNSLAGTVIGTFEVYIGEPGVVASAPAKDSAAIETPAQQTKTETQPANAQPAVNIAKRAMRQARNLDGSQWHVVQPGDTLSGISSAYIVGMRQIMEMNDLADANKIMAGEALLIKHGW